MTEFIAQAKRKDTGEWIEGYPFKDREVAYIIPNDGSAIVWCNSQANLIPDVIGGKSRFVEVDKNTVCWKCPETPYFEHDVLKVVDDFGDVVINEILFFQGAFLFPIEEDVLITIPNLIERGYKIELL